jgi:hypothetical protein
MNQITKYQRYIILNTIEDYYKREIIKKEIVNELTTYYLDTMYDSDKLRLSISIIERKYDIVINFELSDDGIVHLMCNCDSIKI